MHCTDFSYSRMTAFALLHIVHLAYVITKFTKINWSLSNTHTHLLFCVGLTSRQCWLMYSQSLKNRDIFTKKLFDVIVTSPTKTCARREPGLIWSSWIITRFVVKTQSKHSFDKTNRYLITQQRFLDEILLLGECQILFLLSQHTQRVLDKIEIVQHCVH